MNNFWKIFCGLLLILVLVLWLTKGCGGGAPNNDLVVQHDNLLRKVARDSIDREAERRTYDSIARVSRLERVAIAQRLNRSEILLYQSQGTINRLTIKLQQAKEQPFDSSFIYVSPDYITACDSLGVVAGNQDKLLAEAKDDMTSLIDLMNYEINIRDSAIARDTAAYNELRADFNAQTHFFNLAIKKAKPRTKVYAGVSALGNNVNPFGGGEVSGMLVNKKDQAFELGAGFMGANWYARAGVKFKIKF